jgi:hypothetical protein
MSNIEISRTNLKKCKKLGLTLKVCMDVLDIKY